MSVLAKESFLDDSQYVAFGVFSFIFVISTMYNMPIMSQYNWLLRKIYYSILIIASCFMTYPIWVRPKIQKIISIAWYAGIFYTLVFIGSMFVILSNASQLQVMMFMLNIFVMSVLLNWMVALMMLIVGIISSAYLCRYYLGVEFLFSDHDNLKLKLVYIALFVSVTLVIFTRPKQAKEKLEQDFKNHIKSVNKEYENRFIRLFQYRQDFVNRIDEECIKVFQTIHAQSKAILDALSSSNDKEALINSAKNLTQITERLKYASKYLLEIIHTVKDKVRIHLEKINLEEFLITTINEFQKLYVQEGDIHLRLNTKVNEIEFDSNLIKGVINHFLHTVLSANKSTSVEISVDNDDISFKIDLPDGEYTLVNTKAIRVSIAPNNATVNWKLMDDIDHTDHTDVNLTDCYNVIAAHYGNIKNDGNVAYSISIPIKISDIRPKLMDIPDVKLEDLSAVSSLFIHEKTEILRSIANKLLHKGMMIDDIAEVLKIEQKEVISLING